MIDVGYVILHYQSFDDTLNCVKSIKEKHGDGNVNIVIVDNASPNGSGKRLESEFSKDSEVVVLCNKENVGFSNGLNIGIRYIREHYECSFIVLLNNDTELVNDKWDVIIKNKYEEYGFAVMGPDIRLLSGTHVNPSRKQDTSIEGLNKMITQKKIDIILYKLHIKPLWIWIKQKIKSILKIYNEKKAVLNDTIDVQLQGSCLILSKKYFENYEALYKKTFLYFEEAILKRRCDNKGLVSLYTPNLILLHKESSSVNQKISRKKKLFYLQHSLNSCIAYKNDIELGLE